MGILLAKVDLKICCLLKSGSDWKEKLRRKMTSHILAFKKNFSLRVLAGSIPMAEGSRYPGCSGTAVNEAE